MLKGDFNARFAEGLCNKSLRKSMRAFLADMDRTDDDFKIVRDKAVQFEREIEDEMMSRGISSQDALVDTVSQMSVVLDLAYRPVCKKVLAKFLTWNKSMSP